MEFRLLGPLEVRDGPQTVTIGAPKQRALLAYLLLHHGEVVPVGRLADALWEDAPPATATKTIQVYVAQLRKTLGGDLLVTEPGGYAAALNGHELDVDRFQRELDEGGRALDAGEPAAAARTLGDALGLWRGAPLADLPQTHAIRDHAARLEEDRLWALEHRIDADLALARHERLVAELRELVSVHPLRERLRAQLMTALYRCGRQAEALETYREGRALLVEELGIEPGIELQQLEHAILTHDPILAAPARLPPHVRRRRRILAALAGAAAAAAAVLALVLPGDDDTTTPPPSRGDSLVAVDVVGGRIVDEIRVGRSPSALTADEAGIWVLNADDRTISQINRRARTVHTFGIGASPTDVALGLGSLWVGNGGRIGTAQFAGETATAITRLDPATGFERGTTPLRRRGDVVSNRAAQHIAFAAGSVWAINPDFSVSRIDPRTGRVRAVVRGLLALGLAGEGDELWAVTDDRTVTRIDTRRDRVARRIRVPGRALDAIALGAGSVWATDPTAGVLWRVDPSGQIEQRTIDVGAGADGITYGAGSVWLTNSVLGTLTRVDPSSNRVTRTLRLPGSPHAVMVSGGTVWTAVSSDGAPAPAVLAGGDVRPVSGHSCGPVLTGPSAPQRLIVSDLPLRMSTSAPALQMNDAVLHVLRRHRFRAGRWALAYQSCDDSVARTGQFDAAKCAANARAYRGASSLIGVVGPMNSACAAAQLPLLDRGGPAMVSPSNSDPSLTHRPTRGPPGYARLVAPDDAVGAAQAVLAQRLGVKRPFVVHDGGYGATIEVPAARALQRLGIAPAGVAAWDYEKRDYAALVQRVAHAKPDALLLCGLLDTDAGAVLAALRRALGAGVPVIACEGLLPTSKLFARAGKAARGVYVTVDGLVEQNLPQAGQDFVRDFSATHGGATVDAFAFYAAQATEVMLDAIARSDGSRESVRQELLRTRVDDGLLGSFAFDSHGDPDPAPVAILRVDRPGSDLRVLTYDGATVLEPITPPRELWGDA